MILAAVVAASLIIPVSVERGAALPPALPQGAAIPAWKKAAAIRPLINSATECIARTVSADPRFANAALNDLIVDSMSTCVRPLRAMIDAYDGLFGDGAGETFFMGPYLDALPAAVSARVKDAR